MGIIFFPILLFYLPLSMLGYVSEFFLPMKLIEKILGIYEEEGDTINE